MNTKLTFLGHQTLPWTPVIRIGSSNDITTMAFWYSSYGWSNLEEPGKGKSVLDFKNDSVYEEALGILTMVLLLSDFLWLYIYSR